ncbi:MAG: cytochrome c oxidase subunit II [Calothrix sp. C42_A2020_038]|nr:cytochrome c oxidase subunit II [Calothrix sp. C42_A2020_038]
MKIRTILTLSIVTLALIGISLWMGNISKLWFPPQATAEAVLIDDLFSFLVTIGTFIFVGVTGTLIYSILFQRAGKYDMSDGPAIEGNVTLEIVWTAIPFFLVLWIGAYSYQVYDQMAILGPMEHLHTIGMQSAQAAPVDTAKKMTEVEVLAKQWSWEFRYPDANVTSTELHLPNAQRVRLKLTSTDVIHGFYIPAFRLKQDIIPQQTIDFEFTPIRVGKYRLRDSEFSGTYFAAMQTDVVVETPEDFSYWLAAAAKREPTPAYNQAFAEYKKHNKESSKGWVTVAPATPPIVNYPSTKS